MLEDIIDHLKEVYIPDVIILHGSRARGREREHSDWDFIFLYNRQPEILSGRELYKGQNIEFGSYVLPVTFADVENEFSTKLQGAKVVYEKDAEGTMLLDEARAMYQKGVHWSKEKVGYHKLLIEGRIAGMKDNTDNPMVFSKYLADLYQRVFNYWYWLTQNSFSKPIYMAVEEVAEKDPEYYRLVSLLIDTSASPAEKVQAVEEIRDRLFSKS